MTKKDYKLIAESLNASTNDFLDFGLSEKDLTVIDEAVRHIVINLSMALGRDNPKFDPYKFLEACGWPEDYVENHMQNVKDVEDGLLGNKDDA